MLAQTWASELCATARLGGRRMTLEEIYFISQTIAAVAVIASLVYLALQTRQAAKNSRAAMHESRAATELHHIDTMTDREFHPIWAKGNAAAADMSDAEIGKICDASQRPDRGLGRALSTRAGRHVE